MWIIQSINSKHELEGIKAGATYELEQIFQSKANIGKVSSDTTFKIKGFDLLFPSTSFRSVCHNFDKIHIYS